MATDNHPERTAEAAAAVLQALAEGKTPATAARLAGLELKELRRWQAQDPRFAERMADALMTGDDLIEDEVFRRGVTGIETPIVNRKTGEIEGYSTKYSDALLLRLLEARNPSRWRSRVNTGTGAGAGDQPSAPDAVDLSGLTLEEQRTFRDLLARAEQRRADRANLERQSRSGRPAVPQHQLN